MKNSQTAIGKTAIIAAVFATMSQSAPALSQDESLMIEEIIVTARKRSESLQDVPMAVHAFSRQQLKDASIDNIVDLARMTSNITLNETSGLIGGTIQIFMRGIGNDPGIDQGIGLYVDDVYINRTTGALLEVYDVDRIEILKGPQGSLYGRNTVGGAIKYITRQPSDELTAEMEFKAGTYDQRKFSGSVSGPLIPGTLYGGIGFVKKDRDGHQTNIFDNSKWYAADTQAIRGNLLYTPSDDFRVKLAVDYSKDDSKQAIPGRVATKDDSGLSFVFTGANRFFGPDTAPYATPNDARIPSDIDKVNSENVGNLFTSYDNFKIETKSAALTFEYDYNDYFTFKSVTSARFVENTQTFDFDGSDQHYIRTLSNKESDDYSQEFQLNYSGDSVNAVMGLYYLDATNNNNGPGLTEQTSRIRVTTAQNKWTFKDERKTESKSIYGNLDWDISDEWQLSIGGRYTQDEKELEQIADVTSTRYALATTSITGPRAPLAIVSGAEVRVAASPLFTGWLDPRLTRTSTTTFSENTGNKKSWSEFSNSAQLSYRYDENIMVYTGFSSGFKSGGFKTSGGSAESYNPEFVDSFTLGVKSTLLNGSMNLNFEAFYNDYTDKQLNTIKFENNELVQTFLNVGEVTSSGAEVEMFWLTPLDGLMFNLNIGYLNAEIDSYPSVVEEGVNKGDKIETAGYHELGYAPEWTASARWAYEMPLSSYGTLMLGADVAYRTEMYTNSPIDTRTAFFTSQQSEEHVIWNAIAAFRSNDQRWRIALEAKNLEDRRVLVNTFNVASVITGGYNLPRSVALSVGYSF